VTDDLLRTDLAARLRAAGCVFAEEEAGVLLATSADPDALAAMVARRATGVPLEYVVGWADFCGVRVTVTEGVFVPRPRSALLVREAVKLARHAAARPDKTTAQATAEPTAQTAAEAERPSLVVDLCCGTGAIGAAVAARVPGIDLRAADLEPAAVACARANLAGPVYQGDLFDALPADLRGRIDVLVANVPYVPTDEVALLPAEARLHEPRSGLDGGPDGLAVLRRVAAGAPHWLAPAGAVLMETSEAQRPAALRALAAAGLRATAARWAELEATVVIGRRTK
jgi:release factor glutamine methyltransferase